MGVQGGWLNDSKNEAAFIIIIIIVIIIIIIMVYSRVSNK